MYTKEFKVTVTVKVETENKELIQELEDGDITLSPDEGVYIISDNLQNNCPEGQVTVSYKED